MLNPKSVLRILILCSFSILLTLAFNPQLQKGSFYVAPDSPFSYELLQTRNGTIAHYYQNFSPSISGSRFMLFDAISGDGYEVLLDTAIACQIVSEEGTPTSQPIHYHTYSDNLVYFCPANSSLLFINQADHTVLSALPLNLNGTLHHAKLATEGWTVSILAMDTLFTTNPQSSVLIRVDMLSKQIVSQMLFNQNLTSGEAVVAYAFGPKTNYIATNIWQNNNLTTNIYSFIILDSSTYQIAPVVNFTSSAKTITKLYAIGYYFIVNVDTTLYYLKNVGTITKSVNIRTKELTEGIFHPAVVRSTDGNSLYLHTDALSIVKHTIVEITIFTEDLGPSLDMQIAYANQASNDLMFTYDLSRVFFNILDLKTKETIRTAISGPANDLMLTNITYTLVRTLDNTNNIFYIFDLKTDSLVMQVNILSSKYYYNKDQHIVTFLSTPVNSSCQVTHLDLVSGQYWTTLDFNSSSDACSGYISYARVTENGNPELVIPLNQSYLIISETYGQITFNTNSSSHDNDIINVNFDNLSLYYYHADQTAIQINASLYTFDPESQSFQLNSTHTNKRYVDKNHLFAINENVTLALGQMTLTLINQLSAQWFNIYVNNFNLATGFEDQNGDLFFFFSYLSSNNQYPLNTTPLILNSSGAVVPAPIRENTVSGQATGPRSFALYDKYSSNIGVVRFYNSDPQDSKALISI